MLVGYLLDRNDRVGRDGGSSENQGVRGQHFFIDRICFASFLGKNLGGLQLPHHSLVPTALVVELAKLHWG